MTIRLRCAECQRKLKVPDEALGKKVQCPACGARFIGRLDADPPPPPAPASAPSKPAASFPNLQLEEPSPLEAIEPLAGDEPVVEELVPVDEAEVTAAAEPEDEGVDPIVMEDEPIVDLPEAVEEIEAVDVVDEAEEEIEPEIVDEEESDEEAKPRPKKKKSRSMLYVWVAIGFVLLLGCAGGGYAVYLYINGTLFESKPKPSTLSTLPVQPRPRFPPGPGLQPKPGPQPTPGQRR